MPPTVEQAGPTPPIERIDPSLVDPGPIDESATAPLLELDGEPQFVLGVNLPWFDFGCDFGCGDGARAGEGVSSPDVLGEVAATIESAAVAGVDVVRWWLFPGEPWQITTGLDGNPSGIEDDVFADMDAALAIADLVDVEYVFTLFAAPSDVPAAWLTTETGRERLAEVLGELFARYGDHPRIFTWQVVDEPEWEIWNGDVELADVQDLVTRVVAEVHENSDALASVGSANLEGLEFWLDSGLDYYTSHWYDPMDSGQACAVCTSYSQIDDRLDLDAPLVIGEFYGGPDVDSVARLESFRARGYAGAWAWSLFPDRTDDELEIDLGAFTEFDDG